MAVRRMSSIIAVLLIIAISGFFVLCSESQVEAMVDPSPSEEQAKTVAASESNQTQTDTDAGSKKKKSKSTNNNSQSASGSSNAQSGSNSSVDSDDEDVVEENAFTTPGNATIGDMIKSSGSKDFYTIRTENDNTFYLVIDHSGNMDNVYMLSAIDENDLKEFLENEDDGSGAIVLPETVQPEQPEGTPETTEKEPEKNPIPGIISLVLLIAGGIAGAIMFRKYRRETEVPEDDYSENMEDDGLPTVNEDEEFLE